MNEKKFIEQLTRLISFKTITGDVSENSDALDYVTTLINKKAFIKRIKNNNAEILIAGNTDTNSPDVAYLVHMDVVFAQEKQFKAVVVNDKIYGRGASDMKFSIPLGIEILNELISKKTKLTFSLVITTDEEVGGFDGGNYLAKIIKFRPKCLIVPDGGDNVVFVNKAKGVCQLQITAKGIPAHASRPWMGKNAINDLIKLANNLINKYEKNSSKPNWNTTINIGQIHGGVSTNQVCAEAIMKLDFRFPEIDSIENITEKVTEEAKKINRTLKVEVLSTGLPTYVDPESQIVKNFLFSMEKIYDKSINISETYGASDARHFAPYNIPVLMIKPAGGEIHSEDEWVSIKSSLKFYEGLRFFLNNML